MSIRRHTTYNLLGAAIPLAVSLVTIPLYIRLIGEARYGVLAIAWLLLGYFGLFDLGLGRATAQRIAALGKATTEERARTFWTALAVNLGLGVVGGLFIWPVAAYFFGNLFKIEDALRPEVEAAVPWLILAVPMVTTSGVLTGALQGRERFLDLNLISISSTVLLHFLPLGVAIVWTSDLGTLLPVALSARLLALLMLFHGCRRHLFLGHAPTFAFEQSGQLLRFGGWVTVSSFVGPMMVILDRFVIGAVTGAKAVTYYAVPFRLAERSTIFSGALVTALFPRFAAATPEEQKRLAQEGFRALMVIVTPLVALGILLMEPFLSLWITPAFAERSTLVGQIILLGFWLSGFARIPYTQLQARGRPDLVAKCYLAEVLPYFGLLYLGVSAFGLVGAALAFLLRVLLDFTLLAGFAGILRSVLRGLLSSALVPGAAFLIARTGDPYRPEWLTLIIVFLLITIIWSWRQAPDSFRNYMASQLGSISKLRSNRPDSPSES